MHFHKKIFLVSQCICLSCEKYKTISEIELLVKDQWNRKEVLQNKLKVDKDCDNVGFVVDIHYGDDVQYQNIFLHVTLKDAEGSVIFDKPDLLLMLFDPATGYPLGRKILRKQHLEFIIDENIKLKQGDYFLQISQKTRAENLCGINKIVCKLITDK